MNSILVSVNTEEEYKKAVVAAVLSPWYFRFPVSQWPTYREAKSNYRGNSKLLLELFHNSITGNYEMQVTTAAVWKSYPQNTGKPKIIRLNDLTYDYMLSVFGNADESTMKATA